MKKLFLIVVLVFIGFANIGVVSGAVVIDDPEQLIFDSNAVNHGHSISMFSDLPNYLADNLMERIDGVDYVVDKGEGQYYIFLMKQVAENIVFGGYLSTDNLLSNDLYSQYGYSGFEGYMDGVINSDVFFEGDSIDYALCIFDPDGGQFAALRSDNGTLIFDENLEVWSSGMSGVDGGGIEYNGVADGLVTDFVFPAIVGGENFLFEHTVLTSAPVPEPGAILLCCFGTVIMLIRKNRNYGI